MKFLDGFQGVCKNIVLLKEEITDEEVQLYSTMKLDLPRVSEKYNIPFSDVLTDNLNQYDGEIPYGYPYGGMLYDQKTITANTLYKGLLNEKVVLCLAKVSGDWVLGTEIPSSNFDIIDIDNIISAV